tara:strand:- start:1098 stop:3203 length:2106 start_codon:yes stop_codon:yes gene_type:complete
VNLILSQPNLEFWLILFLCIIGFIFSFYQVSNQKKLRPIILLRGILILILVLLFLDPKVEINTKNFNDMKWHLYLDRSLSMSYHTHPSVGSLVSGFEQIIEKIERRNIPIKVFGFGSDLDTSWVIGNKKIQDGSTDLGQVLNHIRSNEKNDLAGSVIITDGQVNLGVDIPSENLNINSPIHIVGVGDETPLVDVSIHAIDAPPVIIKGENADFDVTISSHGTLNERLNVTIYSGKKLIGSKVVTVSGDGSLERVRFRINPTQSGQEKYRVQVNALPDEINIQNNKQIVPIQVLKNEYTIALITGAPNFNTQVIKQIISKNSEYQIDHFIFHPDGYTKNLKLFWDTKYDLILFDNHPIQENANEWQSYIRILAKKLVSQQSSLAIVVGNETHEKSLASFLGLMDITLNKPHIEFGSLYEWKLSSRWDNFFPFHIINLDNMHLNNLPPILLQFEVDSSQGIPLAHFSISDVEIPLLMVSEKSSLRFMVWTSPGLNTVYYKTQNSQVSDLSQQIFDPVLSWLMRTGNGQDYYFRSEKNSYQQGEKVTIKGKAIRDDETVMEGFVHVSNYGQRINSKPITYDDNTGYYTGQFWASQSGKLDYQVEFIHGDKSMIVNKGSVQVQESQVELNHVYLNMDPLQKLAELGNGTFRHWDNRLSLINQINPVTKLETFYSKVVLHDNRWLVMCILGLLSAEWVLRKRLGLM